MIRLALRTFQLAAGGLALLLGACSPSTTDASKPSQPPAQDSTPPAIASVAAAAHTCAVTTAGAVACWGYFVTGSSSGHPDSLITNPTPVVAPAGVLFQRVFVSKVEDIACALSITGAAYCWGENDEGQLGDGTTTPRANPTLVSGGITFKDLSIGANHVCGLATNGAAYCWGFSANGAFGDGSVGERHVPAPSAAGLSFQSIVAGVDFTCGLTPAGAAYCWGLGNTGQLGDGNATTSATPVAVSGGLSFHSLAASGQTVCGLTTTGKAYCWGEDFYGTVGDGSGATVDGITRRVAPVAVATTQTFQTLSAGYETMCGVSDSGAGFCWGYNFGEIGDGSSDHRSTPTAVAGGLTFVSISGGTGYACGVTVAATAFCWGDNSGGGLGDGTVLSHSTPIPVRWP